MDALQLLKLDHDKVRSLFKDFRAASQSEDTQKMKDLAEEIFRELEVHTAIEERVFYPAVMEAGGGDLDELTHESNEEHHVVDLIMEEVRGIPASDERFKAKMTVMIENVEHHAKEEEDEMFPKVRDLMGVDELEELGRRLEEEKGRVKMGSKSKEELYRVAKEKGIEGRSQMSKEELAEAVADE